jgi:hypothetical protein
MSLNPSLILHSSEQHAAWEKVLHGDDDELLAQLQRVMIPLLTIRSNYPG